MEAIEKMRAVLSWANYQSEDFNQRFVSISDIELVYDYCQSHNELEFLDSESLSYLSDKDYDKVVSEVCLLLGYSIFKENSLVNTEKYFVPKKDGFVTEYSDGTRFFGSWSSRLLQHEKLISKK